MVITKGFFSKTYECFYCDKEFKDFTEAKEHEEDCMRLAVQKRRETERREIQEEAEGLISEGTLESYQLAKTLYIDNALYFDGTLLFEDNHYKTVSELNMKIAALMIPQIKEK